MNDDGEVGWVEVVVVVVIFTILIGTFMYAALNWG